MNNNIDLTELTEKIYQKIVKEISEAYYENRIDEVLKKYHLNDEFDYPCYDISNSKILVVGDSRVGKDDLVMLAKKLGIKESCLEFLLDYEKITNYNFGNLRNSFTYSDILVGPMPHKVKGIDGYTSFLAMTADKPEEFPKVTRLVASNEEKITKESFKKGILNTRLYNDLYN